MKMDFFKRIFFIIFLLSISNLSSLSLASHPELEAVVDKNKAYLNETVQLTLTFYGVKDMPAPALPNLTGFQTKHLRSMTIMSKKDGDIVYSTRHLYVLLPQETGVFDIGPLTFNYENSTYELKKITISVLSGSAIDKLKEQTIPVEQRARFEENAFVLLRVAQPANNMSRHLPKSIAGRVGKNNAYLNEIFPVTIKLYSKNITIVNVGHPPIITHDGFSLGEFKPFRRYKEEINNERYDVQETSSYIYGIRPGKLTIGPAVLKCIIKIATRVPGRPLVGAEDLVSKYGEEDSAHKYEMVPFEFTSDKISIDISNFPEQGMPADFQNIVGDFNFEVGAAPTELKAGDSIALNMTITGKGNFNVMQPPRLETLNGFKIYEPRIKTQKEGQLTYEQILIPQSDEVRQIPKIIFSFFNPLTSQYQTITKGPIPIMVAKPLKVEEPKIVEAVKEEEAPKDLIGESIVYIKDSPGTTRKKNSYLYNSKFFLLIQPIPMLLYFGILILHKRNERLKTDAAYARYVRSFRTAKKNISIARHFLGKNMKKEFYDSAFKTLQQYFGDKFYIPAGGVTDTIVDEILKPKGFDSALLKKAKEAFNGCNTVRFTSIEPSREDMNLLLKQIQEIIYYIEKKHI